jgi:trimeric autotransporter adhesin
MSPKIRPAAASVLIAAAMLSQAPALFAQAPLFEVERSDATKLLQVDESAGFLARGSFGSGAIPMAGAGVRMMWYPGKAAFRVGVVDGDRWDDARIGQWSMALGRNNIASGTHSLALNADTEASGDRSIAAGGGSTASASFAFAMGQVAVASGSGAAAFGIRPLSSGVGSFAAGLEPQATGPQAVALSERTQATGANSLATGFQSKATGNVATAMGTGTTAAGAASFALGSGVTAQGDGSFIFGDRNVQYGLVAAANTFHVRAFGGIALNTGVAIGCDLPAGSGAWACTSSRLAKEGFEEVDGEEILAGLAGMHIQRWRYLGTDAAHLGPTAEDFHAAFGLGESSTKIASVDANGVALRAVQALERRTDDLREENAALRAELTALRAELRALADTAR